MGPSKGRVGRAPLAVVAVLVLLVAGCQTGRGDPGPAGGPAEPDVHPCAGGAPELESLGLDDFEGGEPTEEDMAWQMEAGDLAVELTSIAGGRLAAVWIAWQPERSVQVRLTEGPEIPELQAAADASGVVVDIAYDRVFSEAELHAAARSVDGTWEQVPGVAGMGVDTVGGRLEFDVASGDDGGAATCAALTELLADVGVPYAFEVFEGSTDPTVRGPAAISEAWLYDDRTLHVNVGTCGGDPEITVLEETDTEVRLSIVSTDVAQGWPSTLCLDGLDITLEAPFGERTLVDLTTGRPHPVGGTAG